MTWSFPVGRVLGTEVRIHATFFLLLLWIGLAAYSEGGGAAAFESLAFILALFACVLLHEFGHVLTARGYGISTPDITLLPIGGMARLERMPEQPKQEIIVALAGPAVNVVIWAILVYGFGAAARMYELQNIADPDAGFLSRLAAVNLFLVLFNMIPAFPMDGGRVFRAVLSIFLGRVRATRVAARAGQVLAFGFALLSLSTGNPILLLIAVFVFIAASAESSDVALRDLARDLSARAAMITEFETLAENDSVEAAANSLLRTTQSEFPVVGPVRNIEGVLTRDAIFRAINEKRPRRTVGDIMLRDVPQIELHAPLSQALDALSKGGAPIVAVTDRNGHLLGFINRENIGELMVISGKG